MKTFLIVICCIIFCGCHFTYENNTNNDAALAQLRKETDSLKNEINTLKKKSIYNDTLSSKFVIVAKDSASMKPALTKNKPSVKKVILKQTQETKKTDTTYYFYTNTKKISAKIDPRNEFGKKTKIRFYDLKGNVTFEQEDIHSSYSISTEIKEFHSNGAVKRIVIHLNPGASMHWYETIITFDIDNTPLWKEEITYPLRLEDMMDNKSYWDITKKQWIKQEVSMEQPYVK